MSQSDVLVDVFKIIAGDIGVTLDPKEANQYAYELREIVVVLDAGKSI